MANDGKYQMPAAELQALVNAPRGPEFRLGPLNKTGLLISIPGVPSIAEVAQPELKLAGLRVHPRLRAASRTGFSDGLSLLDIASGATRKVSGLPARVQIADMAWSADERWLAFSCIDGAFKSAAATRNSLEKAGPSWRLTPAVADQVRMSSALICA